MCKNALAIFFNVAPAANFLHSFEIHLNKGVEIRRYNFLRFLHDNCENNLGRMAKGNLQNEIKVNNSFCKEHQSKFRGQK